MWNTLQPFPIFGGGSSAPPLTRFAPNFNGVSQYVELPSEVEFTSDFDMKMTMQRQLVNKAIFGASGVSRCYELANGSLELADAAALLIPNVFSGISVGDVFELKISRVNGVISAYINGQFKGSGSYANPVRILWLGRPQSVANTRSGLFYNYSDSSGNNFPMDDGWANNPTMRNSASDLGSNFFVNPTVGSYWTDNGGGSYSIDSPDGAFNSLRVLAQGLIAGDTVLVEFEIESVSGADGLAVFHENDRISSNRQVGVFRGLLTYKAGFDFAIARASGSGAFTSTIKNIKLRKADGYGEYVNMTEASWVEINE